MKQMIFSDFPPTNIVKLENVGPTFSSYTTSFLPVRNHNGCQQRS